MADKFYPKTTLQDLLWEEETDELVIKENELYDTSRWSLLYQLVFLDKTTGKFYSTCYSCGATECQDESPFEYEGDTIECTEVTPVEVTKIEYHVVGSEVKPQ